MSRHRVEREVEELLLLFVNEVRRIAANMRGWADAAREERLIALGTSSNSAIFVVGERV
jgi:hypothetical protein